ncbi:MAG: hypothetical protein IPL81_13340 [Flavobacteriales bacterium]|nr:hypothetical protein [Flavobacteriales bacterium]
MSGRYDKFNRLEGEDAELAGQALWSYVADVYGPAVIPNILYMTRVSRNPDSGFMYVLGVSLKTLTDECFGHYRARFTERSATQSHRIGRAACEDQEIPHLFPVQAEPGR